MWPFTRADLDKIDLKLQFWRAEPDTPYVARLFLGGLEAVEALGVVREDDFRLATIGTVAAYRGQGQASMVVGMLIGAARAQRCATFTIEDVSPHNPAANRLYQRFGAVALPPQANGHSDYQIRF